MSEAASMPLAACRRLETRLKELAAAPKARTSHLVRLSERLGAVDLLGWLAAQPGKIKGYWADRDGGLEVAALGEADEVKGETAGDYQTCWRELKERWNGADTDTRYYGGFRFGPWHPDDPSWAPFQAYRFVLPEFELIRREEGACELICNLSFRAERDPIPSALATLRAMQFPSSFQPKAVGRVLGRHDTPGRERWLRIVKEGLSAVRAREVEKVVLARRACFELEHSVDAFTLIHRMREEAGRCYLFCGVHQLGVAFVGASPERLYKRQGRTLHSEAVAGTRVRGATPSEDEALATALAQSAKERQEHQLVVDGIREGLSSLSSSIRIAEAPSILKLARLQHLVTKIEANLRPEVDDATLLGALHPTPAVGGRPAAEAIQLLNRLEPFDRGWYTGPVGWVGPDAAEFAVAIRCGVSAGSTLCLFSGAGIVADSDPAAEWDEIESKLSTFLSILVR
ncbi:MAG: isochorismate synthase [Verrucomicrobia bacterium]|nr:isochorismate synthase [Kiritimatiellia bacterium]MCO6401444.1 isochorismate synthase [Verrucomicrobiota bacterium]